MLTIKWTTLLAVACSIVAVNAARATHTISHGFVVLNSAGGGSAFFDTDFPTANPDFTGTVASVSQGQSILLGGEVETTRGSVNSQETAADVAAIHYSFDNVSFTALNLPKVINGNPDRWQQATAGLMAEIGAALPVGVHTLYIRFTATDINHPLAPGLITPLPSTGSYSAQIEVLPATPTPDGADDASATDYIADGWQTGDGASGATFGAWTLIGSGGNSSDNGFFIGTSTNNASGRGPGIDSGGPTTNVAWGLYANNGNTAVAYRRFAGALVAGQEFALAMDNGDIQTDGFVGFVLRNGNQTSDKNVSQRFEFLFAGGESTYKFIDKNGVHDTGIGFTGGGLSIRFTLTSVETYALRVIVPGNPTPFNFSGRLAGSAGLSIESIALYNQNAGTGSNYDAFFNKLLVTTGVAPEPQISVVQILGATNAVVSFHSVAGAAHEIQWKDTLAAESWTTLTNNISSLGGVLQINDWFGASQGTRFYRVKVSY